MPEQIPNRVAQGIPLAFEMKIALLDFTCGNQ